MDVQLKRRASSLAGGYRYGASRRAVPDRDGGTEDDAARLRSEFARQRQRLAQADSGYRALIVRRNDLIAECVQDRLPVTKIAAALGVSTWVVRTAVGDPGEGPPSGVSRESRLEQLGQIACELAEASAARLALEEERQALVAGAHREGALDLFELASLTGLTPEHVRRMVRGVRRPE
ncbi:hypothetical protein BIU82_18850 [Arthrobacter sp. SW1]|uniref:hypothetical protein n=1 Tax=Arthrobacter sp. SW1 TaxID=1920889 RepID=UPI000877D0EF|nr:hypothetical protein [Arthrobacter sp. SW1]OFI37861.1 hypothetical protein BIU82_18850 [Arthrobacter sp. SW1]